jgi:hypothetical protein
MSPKTTATERISSIITWLNLSSWIGWAVVGTGLTWAAAVAWISAQAIWFWNAFGVSGAVASGIVTFALLVGLIGLYLNKGQRPAQIVARVRILLRHGRAIWDEPPRGVTHVEVFGDGTVLIELNQSVRPRTIIVRKEGEAGSLQIVKRRARRIIFDPRSPLSTDRVLPVIVEAVPISTD